jgi:hypothetical protein
LQKIYPPCAGLRSERSSKDVEMTCGAARSCFALRVSSPPLADPRSRAAVPPSASQNCKPSRRVRRAITSLIRKMMAVRQNLVDRFRLAPVIARRKSRSEGRHAARFPLRGLQGRILVLPQCREKLATPRPAADTHINVTWRRGADCQSSFGLVAPSCPCQCHAHPDGCRNS